MPKPKRVRHLSNPQFKPNPFGRSFRDERAPNADAGTLVGGADVATIHDLPERERPRESHGGTAGDSERYRTDDGRIHDERTGYRGWEPRFSSPAYPPEVEKQFEISSGPALSTIERDGDELGVAPTGVLHLDLRLRDLVQERLDRSGKSFADAIVVTVANGVVTLNGTLANRAQQSEIVELVEHVTGVREVISSIEIEPPHQDHRAHRATEEGVD